MYNMIYCQKIMKARYEGWPVEPFINHLQAVGELEPVLLSLGVNPDDRVISIPDQSINLSLSSPSIPLVVLTVGNYMDFSVSRSYPASPYLGISYRGIHIS